MGRINVIFDPKCWNISLEWKSKITDEDIIYKMIVGGLNIINTMK